MLIDLTEKEWEILWYSLWNTTGMDNIMAIDACRQEYLKQEKLLLIKLKDILGRKEDISETISD